MIRKYGIFFSLILVFVAMAGVTYLKNGDWSFLSPENLSNLSQQITQTGILAIGMTLVILIGGIDLSVGSIVAVAGIMLAFTAEQFESAGAAAPYFAMLCAILAGMALGAINGGLIAGLGMIPFVVTLGMLTIARGIAYLITGSQSIRTKDPLFKTIGVDSIDKVLYRWIGGAPEAGAAQFPWFTVALAVLAFGAWLAFHLASIRKSRRHGLPVEGGRETAFLIALVFAAFFFCGWVFAAHQGLPVMVLILTVLAMVASFVLNRTPFGRHLYAIGGNREAARLSGIRVQRCTFLVFTLMGFLCAISGIVSTCRAQGAAPATQGVLAELEAIAAAVVGGTSLMGGVGTIGGTLIGALIIGVVVNGMSIMALPNPVQLVFKGLIIVVAVWIDIKTKNRKSK
ncbi:MAG: hypothetical protein A3G34_16470 [Candidatus Lindowbacteria bacterium RIFCSPLOWO2_12_FULL_62_27]|nr:MAG: hypothetical protein A3I06_00070 [Candidatus Lindowbacteria bacterium RIFCSPLOWO2_02_FULL_62_12]OGH58335.1 MAG: hypothetical protein A3G34_16470 [Candidatus Lindowbacteria bacterium RIFCSPLOWO2_12_FULL_62_27]